MDSNVLMALGEFKFEIHKNTYDRLTETFSWRWNKIDLAGGGSSLHYHGKDPEELELTGTIYYKMLGSTSRGMRDLKNIADKGEPLVLVDGSGNVHGSFVVTGLSNTKTYFNKENQAQKTEFSINLLGYDS